MNPVEAKLLTILRESPKCWRELLPDIQDKAALNDALLQCEKRGEIKWSLKDGLYHAIRATERALESTRPPLPIPTYPGIARSRYAHILDMCGSGAIPQQA